MYNNYSIERDARKEARGGERERTRMSWKGVEREQKRKEREKDKHSPFSYFSPEILEQMFLSDFATSLYK